MAAEPVDVLVVGGGIVGAWVALTAARQGLRTGLVEKGDFASGTSGKTSRLIHGGLRYLRDYRLGLVRLASRERDVLLRIAPSLVKPLTFLIPVYRDRGPKKWQLRVGLWLYDSLSKDKALPRRRWLSREEAMEFEPAFSRSRLVAAALYSDAIVNDARLVLAVVRAAHSSGALVANYARVAALLREGGFVKGAHLVDEETGDAFVVRASVVVNAGGVWAPNLQAEGRRMRLRPTKGVHILVPKDRIGHRHAVVLFGSDGRLMFVIPWGRFSLIGTTDTDYRGDPDAPVAEGGDVDYLLTAANAAFPQARLASPDVVSSYAGLRPLLDTGEGEESRVSRKHKIVEDPDGLLTVVGGKLTTARAMAQEVISRVRSRLPAATKRGQKENLVILEESGGASAVVDGIEVLRIVREEMALHLDDVLVRRTRTFYERPDQGWRLSEFLANGMAAELHWDAARRDAEVARYRQRIEAHSSWRR